MRLLCRFGDTLFQQNKAPFGDVRKDLVLHGLFWFLPRLAKTGAMKPSNKVSIEGLQRKAANNGFGTRIVLMEELIGNTFLEFRRIMYIFLSIELLLVSRPSTLYPPFFLPCDATYDFEGSGLADDAQGRRVSSAMSTFGSEVVRAD